jgi:hypothetical protein
LYTKFPSVATISYFHWPALSNVEGDGRRGRIFDFKFLDVIQGHQKSSEVIQTHSEALQKHSNDTPKYVQSMSEDTSREVIFFS